MRGGKNGVRDRFLRTVSDPVCAATKAAKKVTKQAAKKVTKQAAKKVTKQPAKKVKKQAAKKVTKQAGKKGRAAHQLRQDVLKQESWMKRFRD